MPIAYGTVGNLFLILQKRFEIAFSIGLLLLRLWNLGTVDMTGIVTVVYEFHIC